MCSMFVLTAGREKGEGRRVEPYAPVLFPPSPFACTAFGWMVAMGAEWAKSLATTQHCAQQLALLQVALVTFALEYRA